MERLFQSMIQEYHRDTAAQVELQGQALSNLHNGEAIRSVSYLKAALREKGYPRAGGALKTGFEGHIQVVRIR